jgi:hypothetical protein
MTDEQRSSFSKNSPLLRPKPESAKRKFNFFSRVPETHLRALRPSRPAGRFEHPETKIGNPTATHGSS